MSRFYHVTSEGGKGNCRITRDGEEKEEEEKISRERVEKRKDREET